MDILLDPIPLLNIGTFITSLLCLWVTFKLHAAYIKDRSDVNLRYFTRAYLLLTFYFGLQSLPIFVLSDAFWIQVERIIGSGVIFATVGTLALVPLGIIGKQHLKKPFLMGWTVLAVGSIILQGMFYELPELLVFNGNVAYWTDGTPIWLQNLNGVVFGIPILLTAGLFFRSLSVLTIPWLRTRSILMGVGFVFFGGAGLFYHVLAPYWYSSPYGIVFGMAAVGCSIVAILLVLAGVLYRRGSTYEST